MTGMTERTETERLILRKAEDRDLETVWLRVWKDARLAERMLWAPTETREAAEDRMARTKAYQAKYDAFFVCLKETDEPIGFAGIREIAPGEYEESGVCIAKAWHLTAFASYRGVDATLNKDSTARTLLRDGYHRTQTELNKKHNTHETDLGGSIGYRQGTFHVNMNMVYTHFNRQLIPQQVLYKRYAASGTDFTNVSVDYGYNTARWGVAGETAVNGYGALATINTVNWRATEGLTLMLLHRYYDKRYTALHRNR